MGADIFDLNSFIQNMSGGVLAEGGGGGVNSMYWSQFSWVRNAQQALVTKPLNNRTCVVAKTAWFVKDK